jgi:hypothetical protein
MLRHAGPVATQEPTGIRVAAMLVRGYIDLFERRGVMEKIRPKMSPALAAFVAHPPLPIAWVDANLFYELFALAGEATSYAALRQFAMEHTSQQVGPMLLPMLKTLLRLWGATPATLFKNAASVVGVQSKGTRFNYVPESETSGVLEIDPGMVMNPVVWAGWEGTFLFAFEVAGVKGEMGKTEVLDGGRRGRIPVRWWPEEKEKK